MLVEVRAAGHRTGVQSALVGEHRIAHIGLLRIRRDVDQFGDVVGHRSQSFEPLGGDRPYPQLQREVGDGGGQVRVAGPLPVAVDTALHLRHPGLDGHQ